MLGNSLVHRIGAVVTSISIVALVNIAISMAISASIQGSATAINVAGSLRMQSYVLFSDWLQAQDTTPPIEETERLHRIDDFTRRLNNPALVDALPQTTDHPLAQRYQVIISAWQHNIRPTLLASPSSQNPVELRANIASLVAEIEVLVTQLEERTEARVRLMNLVQTISLVFAALVIFLMMIDIKNRVIKPLGRLLQVAYAVGRKDFDQRANLEGKDELSKLGKAFDQMTSALAVSYSTLESEASEKTRELEKSHAALELLHKASRSLYSSHDLCGGAIPLLQNLEELLSIGPIRLFLHDRNSPDMVEAITTATVERPYYCKDHDCNACLVTPTAFDCLPNDTNGRRLLLPIQTANTLLGTLEVWYRKEPGLPDISRRLLETLCDQLATAIFLQNQITEQQQLTLAEERAVIARELHDSLAQSLSYLKMQVARLRRVGSANANESLHEDILNELSTGLNSAYRQLRELLTTFRLKLDTPDLGTALRETITEFGERLESQIHLDYHLPPRTLSANEEIHVLQIVREALANTVKHAEATRVEVEVLFDSPKVSVVIRDNGVGLPDGEQPAQHYGLIIMQDRARTLGGKLMVHNVTPSGVEVSLTFVPQSRHLIPTKNLSEQQAS
ncbi:histidine kinase [Marinobacter zhejiangensis]|nr:histidine kinase [Marinobacter zhejiangensis]